MIGAGPAGLSAARTSASLGLRTLLFERWLKPGGQARLHGKAVPKWLSFEGGLEWIDRWFASCEKEGVVFRFGSDVWSIGRGAGNQVRILFSEKHDASEVLSSKLIIATGSIDRAVPFPGWTRPGVLMGCGALAMVNEFGLVPGTTCLVVGSGLIAAEVASDLQRRGVNIAGVAGWPNGTAGDIADVSQVARAASRLLHLRLRRSGVQYYRIASIIEAQGEGRVETVRLQLSDGSERIILVDTVAVCEGLQPDVWVASGAGCVGATISKLGGEVICQDGRMRTNEPDIYVAGDVCGIGGVSVAVAEGQLAALTAAYDLGVLKRTEYKSLGRRLPRTSLDVWTTFMLGKRRRLHQSARARQRPQAGGCGGGQEERG